MKRKHKIAVLLFLAAVLFTIHASSATIIDIVSSGPAETLDLLEKIKEGQALLKSSAPLQFSEKTAVSYKTAKNKKRIAVKKLVLTRREVSLAILNLRAGDVFEKRYWLDEDEIQRANRIRKYYLDNEENLPQFVPKDFHEKFGVKVNWWNSHNSDLNLIKNDSGKDESENYLIIGLKLPTANDNFAYPEDITGEKYSDIVYVPYSSALHRAELVTAGKNFLDEEVAAAFETLNKLGVESRAYPEKLVSDTIEPEFVKRLFITEQTDPRQFFSSEDGGLKLAERVLVRLGANKEKAFRYTYSKTGALGLGQIMPGTYAHIVKRYPQAKLLKDIDVGRVDIQNSIMASILTLDDHLAEVFRKMSQGQRAKFNQKLAVNPDFTNEIRAAIYNGGPGKYKAQTATISLRVRETVDFVKKYKMIRELKLF